MSLGMKMRDEMRAKRLARYYGTRYRYGTPNDGIMDIGVVQGLGGDWIVGYIAENGAVRRIKSKHLPASADPGKLQAVLNQWARERNLPEVK